MTSGTWLGDARAELATDRILDAAGSLFTELGVDAVGMAEVAEAAGCSRATLYRYFDGRDALRTAFVHRETRRIGTQVLEEVAAIPDPLDRLTAAVQASLRAVRADAALVAWFTARDAGTTAALAQSSAVIESLVAAFIGDASDPSIRRRARWVVRMLVSLLVDPAPDSDEEDAMIAEFLVPALVADG